MVRIAGSVTKNRLQGEFRFGKFGGPITSLFGRIDGAHPTPHSGTDIFFDEGTPCPSLTDGTVAFVSIDGEEGWGRIFGNSVIVETEDARILYAHFLEVPEVAVGTPVSVGTRLGRIGETGQTTGPHLHLAVAPPSNPWFRKDDDGGVSGLLDPMLQLASRSKPVAPNPEDVRAQLAQQVVEDALQLRIQTTQGAPALVVNQTIDRLVATAEGLRRKGRGR